MLRRNLQNKYFVFLNFNASNYCNIWIPVILSNKTSFVLLAIIANQGVFAGYHKKFKRICFSTNFTIYRFYNILKDVKAGNLYIPATTFKWLKHCRKVEKPK